MSTSPSSTLSHHIGSGSSNSPSPERSIETSVSGFTAVNGRNSQTPPEVHRMHSMADSSSRHAERPDAPRPETTSQHNGWDRGTANGTYQNGHSHSHGAPDDMRHDQTKRKRSDGSVNGISEADADVAKRVAMNPSPDQDHSRRPVRPEQSYAPEPPRYPPVYSEHQNNHHHYREDSGSQSISNGTPLPQHGSNPGLSSPNDSIMSNLPAHIELTSAGVQVDRTKNRKRMFANRTKTGCHTCRKRKKKCDEQKPECANCLRGGFTCEGYASKPTATMRTQPLTKAPLQSKVEEKQTTQHSPLVPRPPAHSFPDSHGTQARPIGVDDERKAPPPPPSWAPPPYDHGNTSSGAYPERPSEYSHQMPSRPTTERSNSSYHQPSSISTNLSNTAQRALAHNTTPPFNTPHPRTPSYYSPAPPLPPTHTHHHPPMELDPAMQKSRMTNGDPYLPYSDILKADRANCHLALMRYNAAASPISEISDTEKERLLKRVLGYQESRFSGGFFARLGHEVVVEAPFSCLYGYNIQIGDDVVIGPHCTILDPCSVKVGAGTRVGANVTLCGDVGIEDPRVLMNPVEPKGKKGHVVGKAIDIAENVVIGAGSIIGGGVKIGRGVIVKPGSVIEENTHVPPGVIGKGNPFQWEHYATAPAMHPPLPPMQ
ncbi:trimeric LpxA-like protein [Eremomyces bilateralis CBS 781.70]|uniref:Trimeric LpxA-like protein n=1 Tax=Eremomyces bilateralis CBS 781.70 TaxID=1392243 RepID=A0A6G1FZ55_9PEZI|nr:trimeric LpxA-like protein [Eremomyces bilateralis CBS 781.70]KAF1810956.1 trimeric LpxA-like protein [Eremomyces bilateralis CBS 781.70]